MLVADMHCDTISEIFDAKENGKLYHLKKNELHMDLEKMKKGDYLLQNFAMFVEMKKQADPLEHCLKLIDLFYQELKENNDLIALALKYDDIKKNKEAGKVSAFLTIEEGGVTRCDLSHLRNFYRLGVRMLTLTWNFENGIGFPNYSLMVDGNLDYHTPETVRGLTDFGLEFIHEMERIGMIIDVSHLSDAGFYQVLNNTTKPFVASHSNARQICGHVRNLTDDMIKQLANRGGVTGMNYFPLFLEDDKEDKGTIASIVKHIKHIANIGGYECIGLGSDFDGIPLHKELSDASYMPLLADALEKEGFSNSQIEGIFYKNVLRVYKEILL
jgi:membrane dipeptidase